MIGSINSLKNINEIIKQEQQKQKSSVVKKLFDVEEVEPEIEFGEIGGSHKFDEEHSCHDQCHEEQKSSEDKQILELEVSSCGEEEEIPPPQID